MHVWLKQLTKWNHKFVTKMHLHKGIWEVSGEAKLFCSGLVSCYDYESQVGSRANSKDND
jgi:hypothetical protein